MDTDLTIKVGDFGLSRDIYETDYYKMSHAGACPAKWMPPEMLRDGISTEKSDIVSLKSHSHRNEAVDAGW